ncbi:hypothetical protein FS749_010831 [Ceratobasidium sp. UAMH 11750]|nr:hypothetical protein FS749_010831 [Ceratobasidium sp. UAMH 11750]
MEYNPTEASLAATEGAAPAVDTSGSRYEDGIRVDATTEGPNESENTDKPQVSELASRPPEEIRTYGSYEDAVLAAAKYVQTGKILDDPHAKITSPKSPGSTMAKYKGTTQFKGYVGLGVQPNTTPLDFLRIDFVPQDPNNPTRIWGLHFNAQAIKGNGNVINTDKPKFAAYVDTAGQKSPFWEKRFNNYLIILQRDEVTAQIVWDAWKNGEQPKLPGN